MILLQNFFLRVRKAFRSSVCLSENVVRDNRKSNVCAIIRGSRDKWNLHLHFNLLIVSRPDVPKRMSRKIREFSFWANKTRTSKQKFLQLTKQRQVSCPLTPGYLLLQLVVMSVYHLVHLHDHLHFLARFTSQQLLKEDCWFLEPLQSHFGH